MQVDYIIIRVWDMFEAGTLVEERTQKGAPVLTYHGADDKYSTVMAAEFSFNMLVTDMSDGKFFHLYTGNERRYKVTVHTNNNSMLERKNPPLFEGYLLPDFYSEPYKNGVFFVELTATDGLAQLKGKYLEDRYYKKETSVIKLICECLKLCDLDRTIRFSPAVMSSATDYLWHEISVNGLAYLDGEIVKKENEPDVLPERKNAYEILEILVKNLGCTLYGISGVWYLEGINRKHEQYQAHYRYNLNAELIGMNFDSKLIQDVVFFDTPNIEIVSPWKRVEVSIDLDEEGDLLADADYVFFPIDFNMNPLASETEISSVPGGVLQIESMDPVKNWKRNGNIVPRVGANSGGRLSLGVSLPGNAFTVPAETEENMPYNFLSLPNPKYVKKSDDYLKRKINFSFSFSARGDKTLGGDYEDEFEDGKLDQVVRFQIMLNNQVLKTINPNQPLQKQLKYDLNYMSYGIRKLTGSVELEDLENNIENGILDLRFYAPVSENPNNPFFNRYFITGLKLEYTPEEEWTDSFVRDIDHTTKYELELFHGDTASDLTLKNFRFRRAANAVSEEPVNVNFLSRQFVDSSFGISRFEFVITYQAYMYLLGASDVIVVYDGSEVSLSDIYPNATDYSVLWGLSASGGVYKVSFIVPISPSIYFSNINLWEYLVVPVGAIAPEYVEENNEWRESWKRYGVSESIRYGAAMAKLYHDVYPEELVRIEGDVKGIVSPREILKFNWRGERQFIPIRIKIDFSAGKSNVLMIESKFENVISKGKYE